MHASNYVENLLIDGILRGGALNAAGALNSSAVATALWAATTAFALGDIIIPPSGFTAAGGKLLKVTTAGTSGSTATLAVPAVGSTLVDGSVTYTAISVMPAQLQIYAALFIANKGLRANSTAYSLADVISLTANGGAGGDTAQHLYRCTTAGTSAASQAGFFGAPGEVITDGTAVFTEIGPVFDTNTGFPAGLTEVATGSYARVAVAPTLANWAGTQSAASTTASTGTGGTSSNNNAITFPAPTADWTTGAAKIAAVALYDQLTSGRLLFWIPLTVPKTVSNGDAAPSFAAAALTLQSDN